MFPRSVDGEVERRPSLAAIEGYLLGIIYHVYVDLVYILNSSNLFLIQSSRNKF
jgi:hypothetical protein